MKTALQRISKKPKIMKMRRIEEIKRILAENKEKIKKGKAETTFMGKYKGGSNLCLKEIGNYF